MFFISPVFAPTFIKPPWAEAARRDKKELEGCETKPCLAIVRVGEKQEDISYADCCDKRT